MTALIHDAEFAFMRTEYPDLDMKRPTPQQEQALMYYFRGMTAPEAARAAGMAVTGGFVRYLQQDSTKAILEYLRNREFQEIRITRDSITAMFFEAYHKAATAMEMIAATRELGKLHGLYPENKPNLQVNVTAGAGSTIEINAKKIERMSDAELLAYAPELQQLLAPPVPIKDSPNQVVSEQ